MLERTFPHSRDTAPVYLAVVLLVVAVSGVSQASPEGEEVVETPPVVDDTTEAGEPSAGEPGPSGACDGQGRSGWMLRETILGLTNALGAAAETRAGYCRPLIRREGVLFSLTQIEGGVFNFLTPSFSRQGAYMTLVPLSFLVLHVSVSGVWYWYLPGMATASYFEAEGYDQTWTSSGFDNDITVHQEQGGGFNLTVGLTVQAAVTIGHLPAGDAELIVLDSLDMDYWYFGTHDYYFNQRVDTVLARSDMVLTNNAALLIGLPITESVGIRFGATDSLGYAPIPGHLAAHQVGGLVMLPIRSRNHRIADLTPFLRVTAYTHNRTRELSFAWNFLLGIDLSVRL
jgi:hypothetical protein